MNNQRLLAGFFTGLGALILLLQNQPEKGMILLVGLLSFFVGERNGERNVRKLG